MTGLDQERLDQLAAARVLHEDDLAAFYALPREATAAENLAADVDPLLNDIGWLLGVVQQLRDEIESLGAMADRMITHARAERDDLRRELRRCRSEHPDNPTVVPCVLDRGHDGPHYSTTGCAGSVMEWPTAAAEIARLRAENENLRASMEDARRAIDASHRELMRKLGADRAGGDTTEPDDDLDALRTRPVVAGGETGDKQ